MRIALVVANNLWFAPYISIYTTLFDQWSIDYDIIYWNRTPDRIVDTNVFSLVLGNSKLKKICAYIRFSKFIKHRIKTNRYDKLVIFGSTEAIILKRFLKTHYSKKYIIDIRDLGIEQSNKLLADIFHKVLKNSFANVVSSPGFQKYLPQNVSYYISHNFSIKEVISSLSTNHNPYDASKVIRVLTIGGIRDFNSNMEVMDALANDTNFYLSFVGKGYAQPLLMDYARKNRINNTEFVGYYEKSEEKKYILASTLINIHYPKIKSHASALSNRFYNSLIYNRPMIVTEGGLQAYYARKFKVGIIVSGEKDIKESIMTWLSKNDFQAYRNNCKSLLIRFLNDYKVFENMLKKFCME